MIHPITITVDGVSFAAIATTSRNHDTLTREVTSVATPNVPLVVMATLDEHFIDIHDVLEVVRVQLNSTGVITHGLTCGSIGISWSVLDRPMLRCDLTGQTYHVKLTDEHGQHYECEVGAEGSWQAMAFARSVLPGPLRSSVVVPLH